MLAASRLTTLPLLQLGSEPRIRATARTRHLRGRRHTRRSPSTWARPRLPTATTTAAARFFAAAREDGNTYHSPRLLRALALGLGGHAGEARAALSAIPPASLPPHALPWRDWLERRLADGGGGTGRETVASTAAGRTPNRTAYGNWPSVTSRSRRAWRSRSSATAASISALRAVCWACTTSMLVVAPAR